MSSRSIGARPWATVTFRPRRRRRLDSADYQGLLPPVVPFSRIVHLIAERRQMTLWEL